MKARDKVNMKKFFLEILPDIVKKNKIIFLCIVSSSVLHGIFSALSIYMINEVFSRAETYVNSQSLYRDIQIAIFYLIIINVGEQLFSGLHNSYIEKSCYTIQRNFFNTLYNRIKELRPLYFEESSNLDEIQKAYCGVENATFLANIVSCIIFYYVPYFLCVSVFLTSINIRLILVLFLVFIPELLIQLFRVHMYAKVENESVKWERKYKHYEECTYGSEYIKDTRMLGAFEYFYNKYVKVIKKYNEVKWLVDKKVLMNEVVIKIITLCGYGSIILYLVYEVINGNITVGNFAAIFASLNTIFSMMETLINQQIARISEQFGSIENMCNFLFGEKRQDKVKINDFDEIVLDNVSFKYPNTERNVINNISISIKKGETIAIVGENGSGKTTLSKIIAGIYEVDEGNALIDIRGRKISLNKCDIEKTAVLQPFQKYCLSLHDNIIISDSSKKINEQEIDRLISEVGLNNKCSDMNKEDNVLLSYEFGGVDLSLGQWQKLAIARAKYKVSNIVILDEPTSSIDPIEEKRLYESFKSLIRDRTCILITHRLEAVQLADEIVVMNEGKIIEKGTHSELLRQKGQYYNMFIAQKDLYKI